MDSTIFHFTVSELIEVLQSYPEDLPVLTSGYESGYENFHQPFVLKLKHFPENPYWEGEFQKADDGDPDSFQALIIQRCQRDD